MSRKRKWAPKPTFDDYDRRIFLQSKITEMAKSFHSANLLQLPKALVDYQGIDDLAQAGFANLGNLLKENRYIAESLLLKRAYGGFQKLVKSYGGFNQGHSISYEETDTHNESFDDDGEVIAPEPSIMDVCSPHIEVGKSLGVYHPLSSLIDLKDWRLQEMAEAKVEVWFEYLTPDEREALRLKYMGDGLKPAKNHEVAKALGVSPRTAIRWIQKGLNKLRELEGLPPKKIED